MPATLIFSPAWAADGLIAVKSPHSVEDTLARRDASGQTWLGHNDPQFLAVRHQAGDCGATARNLRKAPDGLAAGAVQ